MNKKYQITKQNAKPVLISTSSKHKQERVKTIQNSKKEVELGSQPNLLFSIESRFNNTLLVIRLTISHLGLPASQIDLLVLIISNTIIATKTFKNSQQNTP